MKVDLVHKQPFSVYRSFVLRTPEQSQICRKKNERGEKILDLFEDDEAAIVVFVQLPTAGIDIMFCLI